MKPLGQNYLVSPELRTSATIVYAMGYQHSQEVANDMMSLDMNTQIPGTLNLNMAGIETPLSPSTNIGLDSATPSPHPSIDVAPVSQVANGPSDSGDPNPGDNAPGADSGCSCGRYRYYYR